MMLFRLPKHTLDSMFSGALGLLDLIIFVPYAFLRESVICLITLAELSSACLVYNYKQQANNLFLMRLSYETLAVSDVVNRNMLGFD